MSNQTVIFPRAMSSKVNAISATDATPKNMQIMNIVCSIEIPLVSAFYGKRFWVRFVIRQQALPKPFLAFRRILFQDDLSNLGFCDKYLIIRYFFQCLSVRELPRCLVDQSRFHRLRLPPQPLQFFRRPDYSPARPARFAFGLPQLPHSRIESSPRGAQQGPENEDQENGQADHARNQERPVLL